jgi:restriction system protein
MLIITDAELLELLYKNNPTLRTTDVLNIRAKIGDVTEKRTVIGTYESIQYEIEVTHAGFSGGWLGKKSFSEYSGEFALSQAKEWVTLVDRRWALTVDIWKKKQLDNLLERYTSIAQSCNLVDALILLLKDEFPEPATSEHLTPPVAPLLDEPIPPIPLKKLSVPKYLEQPEEPKISDEKYSVSVGVFERLFKADSADKKKQEQEHIFQTDYSKWQIKVDEIVTANQNAKKAYEEEVRIENERYKADLKNYEFAAVECADILKKYEAALQQQKQDVKDKSIRRRDEICFRKDELIRLYFEEKNFEISIKIIGKLFSQGVNNLLRFTDSDCMSLLFYNFKAEIEALPPTRTLVVNFKLPLIEDIPSVIEIKEMKTSDDVREKRMTKAARETFYDDVLYKICLGSIHLLFATDKNELFDAVVFNGYVDFVDGATGKDTTAFIMSLQTTKQEFANINLRQVDPKLCFKSLKGVGSSKLHGITPIRPVLNISKDDSRFVDAVDIADSLNSSTNLAAIDWQEFEHLIRQIFDKEFSQNGGEVKITQASRDGGVDAVAFDNDPIRGGKIVIQAKRYTNTVGVSAVRDLYGTMMNEGAMKGILVTTSDFGPDAHSFAKGKPLTLISGAELLYLFQKHGYEAKIDIRAAKELVVKNNRYN